MGDVITIDDNGPIVQVMTMGQWDYCPSHDNGDNGPIVQAMTMGQWVVDNGIIKCH
jgi:hypothetical protein